MDPDATADTVSGGSLLLTLDPYHIYEESSLAGGNPVTLVVALYDGALTSIRTAKACLDSGDILSRGKAISKAMSIVLELLASLDHERGGEVSRNLQRIYLYVQRRLVDAHAQQRHEPLDEAENLLSTLLDGWKKVAQAEATTELNSEVRQPDTNTETPDTDLPYGFYFGDAATGNPTISVAC